MQQPKGKEFYGAYCQKEVSDLLNCVTGRAFNELKCLPHIRALRKCIEEYNVVDFAVNKDEDLKELKQVLKAEQFARHSETSKIQTGDNPVESKSQTLTDTSQEPVAVPTAELPTELPTACPAEKGTSQSQ